jgi:hypothetical protein
MNARALSGNSGRNCPAARDADCARAVRLTRPLIALTVRTEAIEKAVSIARAATLPRAAVVVIVLAVSSAVALRPDLDVIAARVEADIAAVPRGEAPAVTDDLEVAVITALPPGGARLENIASVVAASAVDPVMAARAAAAPDDRALSLTLP